MAEFPYNAILFHQRPSGATAFCMISAPVGQILQWARVDRLEPNNLAGVQRRKNESKTRSIKQFLAADLANTIPTALTIALPFSAVEGLDEGAARAGGVLATSMRVVTTDGAELPGLIIDGQHRIFGMNEYDPSLLVSVVILLGADDAEIAFQFLVINNKVSKVSPDHMKALRLAYTQDDLDSRLTKSARMRSTGAPTYLETIDTEEDSPFKGRLKWPRNAETDAFRAIPPNAFEAALLYISNQQLVASTDPETKSYDFVVDFFLEIWRQIEREWPQAWSSPNSRLLSKLGVVCFSQYVVDAVVARTEALEQIDGLKDLEQVAVHVSKVLERQDYAFWDSAWSASSLDTDAGRAIVSKDLKRIGSNKRNGLPWATGLSLIDILDA